MDKFSQTVLARQSSSYLYSSANEVHRLRTHLFFKSTVERQPQLMDNNEQRLR